MRILCIQFQPGRVRGVDGADVKAALRTVGRRKPLVQRFEIQEGRDGKAAYVNFLFASRRLPALWEAIQAAIFRHPDLGAGLSKSCITTCEGKEGWSDYLLLQHFDPKQRCARLAPTPRSAKG